MGKFVNMNSHSEKQNQSNETQSNPSSNELRLLGKRIVNEIIKVIKKQNNDVQKKAIGFLCKIIITTII